ncbi:hypothetical protein T06_12736 [Trichinella sp. T6]|nr:hypothetical protein T06_12736 [Trichinella sp. T6]
MKNSKKNEDADHTKQNGKQKKYFESVSCSYPVCWGFDAAKSLYGIVFMSRDILRFFSFGTYDTLRTNS